MSEKIGQKAILKFGGRPGERQKGNLSRRVRYEGDVKETPTRGCNDSETVKGKGRTSRGAYLKPGPDIVVKKKPNTRRPQAEKSGRIQKRETNLRSVYLNGPIWILRRQSRKEKRSCSAPRPMPQCPRGQTPSV